MVEPMITAEPSTIRPISAAALRMRVARQRRRDGNRVVELEVLPTEIEALVAAGWLSETARADRAAIADAIAAMFEAAFTGTDGRVRFPTKGARVSLGESLRSLLGVF